MEAQVPARGRTVDVGDVALDPGLAIRGRVRDREGGAVDGATVRALLQEPGERGRPRPRAAPTAVSISGGLRPGRHQVSASAPGFAMAFVTAEAGGEPVDVVMDVGGAIAGRVVDAEGTPVEEARVTAQADGPVEGTRTAITAARAEEGGGRFLLPDVAPGTYDLGGAGERTGRGGASPACGSLRAARPTWARSRSPAAARSRAWSWTPRAAAIPGATVYADRDANRRTGQLETQTGSAGAFELSACRSAPCT